MLHGAASSIMRTTLDLEEPILEELKSVQQKEGGSLGQLASRLLAEALAVKRKKTVKTEELVWKTRPMGALVDLGDKDAIYSILDQR
jgi:hypothetical protein